MPHADDASGRAARSPDQDDKTGIQPTGGDISTLAVVEAIVLAGQMSACEDLTRAPKIQAAMTQGRFPFVRITGDAHGLIVDT